MTELSPLAQNLLPAGIRARFVPNINGLAMHLLEAGFAHAFSCCMAFRSWPTAGAR